VNYTLLVNRAKKLLAKIESVSTAPGISIIYRNHPAPPTEGFVVKLNRDARYLGSGRLLAYSSNRGHFVADSLHEYAANQPTPSPQIPSQTL
jgi:hypothetical protein